jgi:hypothetical protein
MEFSGNSICETMFPVSDAKNKVNSATRRIAKQISVKLQAFLARNPDCSKLKAISDINNQSDVEMPQETRVHIFTSAPVTTADVEKNAL